MAEEKKDWELNPQNYLTDEDGYFVLKKDGTPRKKGGRPKGQPSRGYNYHSSQKAKIAARRSVRNNEKELEKLTRQVHSKKQTLAKKKTAFKKLDAMSDNQITSVEEIDSLPDNVKKHIEESDDTVVFQANEGPQTEFLAAGELDVLYGGAAGGGKSYAMLVDPLRYCHKPVHRH